MSEAETQLYLTKYNAIMAEIVERMDMVNAAMHDTTFCQGWLRTEICFLQFRKICELIALGCLCAHGDLGIGVHSSAMTDWDVNKIIKGLERLRPDFYPIPVTISVEGASVMIGESNSDPVLGKRDLLRLYGISGDYLHRGSLKKLFAGDAKDATSEIVDWGKRIIALLQEHRITLLEKEQRWLFCRVRPPHSTLPESFITGKGQPPSESAGYTTSI